MFWFNIFRCNHYFGQKFGELFKPQIPAIITTQINNQYISQIRRIIALSNPATCPFWIKWWWGHRLNHSMSCDPTLLATPHHLQYMYTRIFIFGSFTNVLGCWFIDIGGFQLMLAYVGEVDHAIFGVKGNEVLPCTKHGFKSTDFIGLKTCTIMQWTCAPSYIWRKITRRFNLW